MTWSEELLKIAYALPYAVAGCVVAWAMTRYLIALANRHSLHDIPGHRSSHDTPTPRIGGIGVAALPLVFLVVMIGAFYRKDDSFFQSAEQTKSLNLPILIGAMLFFAIGLWDDLMTLPARTKLLLQFGATLIVVALFWKMVTLRLIFDATDDVGINTMQGSKDLYLVNFFKVLVCTLWILGFVNAFNFMDGMNGKAGVFSQVGFLYFLIILASCYIGILAYPQWTLATIKGYIYFIDDPAADAAISGQYVNLLMILIGSLIGFLFFNFRRQAKIFLGDGGSHFLGFMIAILSLYFSKSLFGPGLSLLVFGILLLPFIYDVSFTLLKRLGERKTVWEAHREHLYQRLMICGLSHMQTLAICTVTYLACAGAALMCALAETLTGRLFSLFLALGVMAVYTGFVFKLERKKRPESAERLGSAEG